MIWRNGIIRIFKSSRKMKWLGKWRVLNIQKVHGEVSMGTIGRVASGVSQTLIERAADVMLKERRRLIFVVRETPYSLIHLRNMTTLTEAGAVILPATPSFYSLPKDIEAVCQTVTERVTAMLGLEGDRYEWK